MGTKKHDSIHILSYLLVLVIGGGIGYYFGAKAIQKNIQNMDLMEQYYYSEYMEIQITKGTDAAYEEAIQGFLGLIEQRKGQWTPWFTEKVYATDSALSYVRLFALAMKRGSTDEARKYLVRATSFCPQTGWEECSVEQIIYLAKQLDKRGLFDAMAQEWTHLHDKRTE